MNERVRISIKLYEKYYVSRRRGEAEANIISCPLLPMGLRMIKRVLKYI